MDWEEFKLLEEKIESVIDGYMRLKAERDQLLSLLRQKEEELSDLHKEVEALKVERGEVRSRVERLIERLEAAPLD